MIDTVTGTCIQWTPLYSARLNTAIKFGESGVCVKGKTPDFTAHLQVNTATFGRNLLHNESHNQTSLDFTYSG